MSEDRTKPIRELLGALDSPTVRPMRCGGAIVPVTRDSFFTMQRVLDVDFVPMALPAEGSADARVACTADVLTKPGVGGLVHDGTCARCASVEQRVRRLLAEAAARREGGQ